MIGVFALMLRDLYDKILISNLFIFFIFSIFKLMRWKVSPLISQGRQIKNITVINILIRMNRNRITDDLIEG